MSYELLLTLLATKQSTADETPSFQSPWTDYTTQGKMLSPGGVLSFAPENFFPQVSAPREQGTRRCFDPWGVGEPERLPFPSNCSLPHEPRGGLPREPGPQNQRQVPVSPPVSSPGGTFPFPFRKLPQAQGFVGNSLLKIP